MPTRRRKKSNDRPHTPKRLTPEQEKNWPAFETAARDFGKLRRERFEARRNEQPPASPVERLRRGAGGGSGGFLSFPR